MEVAVVLTSSVVTEVVAGRGSEGNTARLCYLVALPQPVRHHKSEPVGVGGGDECA